MTFNLEAKAPATFPIKNERECNWVYNYMLSIEYSPTDPNAISYESRKQAINKSFVAWDDEEVYKDEFVRDTLEKCSNALIPESQFEWIDNQNECLCRWLHAYLTVHHRAPFTYPTSPDECRQDIITFFDVNPVALSDKENFLLKLKGYWGKFFQEGEKFKWLDKDDIALVEWAWNYSKTKKLPMELLSVLKESERHVALIIIFDQWKAGPDTKKLFIIQMKKALNQKKQRDKRDGKKAYNIIMDEGIKEKLNALAKHHDRKINQTLERLINNEYQKVFND